MPPSYMEITNSYILRRIIHIPRGTRTTTWRAKRMPEKIKGNRRSTIYRWNDSEKVKNRRKKLSHSWLIKCLETINVSQNVRNLLTDTRESWSVEMMCRDGKVEVGIKSGIRQGDALSPLLLLYQWFHLQASWEKHHLGMSFALTKAKINH